MTYVRYYEVISRVRITEYTFNINMLALKRARDILLRAVTPSVERQKLSSILAFSNQR